MKEEFEAYLNDINVAQPVKNRVDVILKEISIQVGIHARYAQVFLKHCTHKLNHNTCISTPI